VSGAPPSDGPSSDGPSSDGPSSDAPPEAAKPLWKNPFLIAFIGGAIFLTVLPFLQRAQMRAPEPLGPIGEFSLLDEHGKAFGSADLKGKVWIATFFFTRCPSVCPAQQKLLVGALPHVEDLAGRSDVAPIELVSFTVDPENDVSAVLNDYEKKLDPLQEATRNRVHLLTGTKHDMRELLVKHFLVVMGDRTPASAEAAANADLYDIAHAAKFALVDQEGMLRGFWSTDEQGRGNVINAARLLAKQGPTP